MHQINGQIIKLSYKTAFVKDNFIIPTIALWFSRSSKAAPNVESKDLIVKRPIAKLSLKVSDYVRYVIGTASSTNLIYTWDINGDSEIEFDITLDSYLLSEIENIRKGGNLNLVAEILLVANERNISYGTQEFEYPFVVEFDIPKSIWNENILPHLMNKKITLVTIPNIELPKIPLTHEVLKYLNEASRALSDGGYGDVFGECRESLNALYTGIDEWVKGVLTIDETSKIQNAGAEKVNARRNIGFTKLVGHEEKGKRINQLRNSLHQFLSLDPHKPDYKGIEFTRGDGISALNMSASFTGNVLEYLSIAEKKIKKDTVG
ncbi:hypothetical protein [Nitrososphaera sp. AFS]|uniref:hypothetical protein n=1 Tax=Nitrososphaera sp. AFS TaxID=2301191 RepID=UPI0013924045|nr:hypothetical protein [Nitrososphaera sp. AFS]NAL78244.1 hypothetical protein [Nitrososphaera sp. AFS]